MGHFLCTVAAHVRVLADRAAAKYGQWRFKARGLTLGASAKVRCVHKRSLTRGNGRWNNQSEVEVRFPVAALVAAFVLHLLRTSTAGLGKRFMPGAGYMVDHDLAFVSSVAVTSMY